MSTASENKFIPEPSQGDFWGGYMMDFNWYKAFALFPITGLLGIDQLALRSPFTAFLKLLVNIFFWGAWYIYDIIQILSDEVNVAKYGFSTPWAPRGHGYKFFSNVTSDNIEEFSKASPQNGGIIGTLLFVMYSLSCLYLSFTGLPSFIAGDYWGGLLKLCTILFLPLYLVTGLFEHFRSGDIEKTGVPRTWPLINPILMPTVLYNDNQETYPAVNLLPQEEATKQLKIHTDKVKAFQADPKHQSIVQWAAGLGATAAMGSVKGVELVAATADVTKAAAQTAQVTATGLQKGISEVITEDPKGFVNRFLPAAPPATAPQTGGGVFQGTGGAIDALLLGGIATLILGGLGMSFVRKINLPKWNQDEHPRKINVRDDSPPRPETI